MCFSYRIVLPIKRFFVLPTKKTFDRRVVNPWRSNVYLYISAVFFTESLQKYALAALQSAPATFTAWYNIYAKFTVILIGLDNRPLTLFHQILSINYPFQIRYGLCHSNGLCITMMQPGWMASTQRSFTVGQHSHDRGRSAISGVFRAAARHVCEPQERMCERHPILIAQRR